jgi:hypothetical protein
MTQGALTLHDAVIGARREVPRLMKPKTLASLFAKIVLLSAL